MISGAYCGYWFRETNLCCLVKLSKRTVWYLTYQILMTKCYPWKTNKQIKTLLLGHVTIALFIVVDLAVNICFSVLKLFVFRFYFFLFGLFRIRKCTGC